LYIVLDDIGSNLILRITVQGLIKMTYEGPPIKFVAIWGLFALLMLVGQMHLINQGADITLSFQIDELNGPVSMAALE
jgi:hypothetical protein